MERLRRADQGNPTGRGRPVLEAAGLHPYPLAVPTTQDRRHVRIGLDAGHRRPRGHPQRRRLARTGTNLHHRQQTPRVPEDPLGDLGRVTGPHVVVVLRRLAEHEPLFTRRHHTTPACLSCRQANSVHTRGVALGPVAMPVSNEYAELSPLA